MRRSLALILPLALAGAEPARGATRFLVPTWAARDGLQPGIVTGVDPGGPAARAGVQVGDTLLAVGGRGFLDLGGFRALIAAAPADSPCVIGLARGGARLELAVALADSAPRLGATLTTAALGEMNGTVLDDDATVAAAVEEWEGLTVVAVRVENRAATAVAFGPDSVVTVDGAGTVVAPAEPHALARERFGRRRAAAAADLPDSVFLEILAGRDPSPDGVPPAQAGRDLERQALRPTRVPPGASAAGLIYLPVENVAPPLEVRVDLRGRTYRFGFTAPR